ncbi:MAG: hypothetical protein ACI36X_06625 [Bacteroidaceae bacterium]
MKTNTSPTLGLQEIAQRKAALREQLSKQRAVVVQTAQEVFAPTPEEKSLHPLMQQFSRGLALYDGVMTGLRIMRRVRRFLSKLR